MRQLRSRHIEPSFDTGVPRVGRLAKILRRCVVRSRLGQFGRHEERGDFGRNRKRRISSLFLPPVLGTHRTIAREKCGRTPHHRPQRVSPAAIEHALTKGEIHQQNRQRRLVHLNAVPVGRAIEPHVLRPMAVRLLCHLQVPQHASRLLVRTHGDEPAGCLHEISRPHQVIATQVVVGLGETPRN